MARSGDDFLNLVLESLAPLGGVAARRMFGGFGIYKDGVMFALIASDQLHFRVDDGNRAAYEAAGLEPFVYTGQAKPVRMPYHEAPAEGFDDPEVLCAWAREAFAAALRVKRAKAYR